MANTHTRRSFANFLLVLMAVLLVALIFEIALRLAEPVSDVQLLTEVKTARGSYFALLPNVHGLVLGRPVTVNEQGYRGISRPREKSRGVTRLLFFGDSHTFSMGADDAHTYPAVVERDLNAHGVRCEVLNFGVPGQDLRQILLLLRARALQYEPDMILITFHSGDILESVDDVVPESREAGVGGASKLYQLKVGLLRHSYLARLVIPYGAALVRRAFGWRAGVTHDEQLEIENGGKVWRALRADVLELKRELDRRDIVLAFALFPSMLPFDDHPARREFRSLAAWLEAHDIPAIDLLPAYQGQEAGQLTASLLDKHPNEKGYAIAGDALAPFVMNILKAREPAGAAARVLKPNHVHEASVSSPATPALSHN